MEHKLTGYRATHYPFPTKRYCQMLALREKPKLIEEYRLRHHQDSYWAEIGEGIQSIGILEMEIYIQDNLLFMIVETPLDFEWKEAFEKLALLPRQLEWENEMGRFQKTESDSKSSDKWQLMDRMFHLYE